MDLILIALVGAALATTAWLGYRTGQDSAGRVYMADLATLRSALRRRERDLEAERELTAMLRRHITAQDTARVIEFRRGEGA